MTMETKRLSARATIKDETKGIVSLVFAEYGTIDKDGDVTIKGAFTEGATVVVSAYGHKSWDGELPVGYGTILTKGNEAVADVQFLMDTTQGRDTFLTVKALGEQGLQEWSYSLEDVVAERGSFEGKQVRFLKKIEVKEVSPVLRGAGTTTRVLEAKAAGRKQLAMDVWRMLSEAGTAQWGADYDCVWLDDFDIDESTAVFVLNDWYTDDPRVRLQVSFTRTATAVTLDNNPVEVEYATVYMPKGSKFSEHTDIALRGVKELVEKGVQRLTQRATEGKTITEQVEARDQLLAAVEPLTKAIDAATQSTTPDELAALYNEYARFVTLTTGA